MRIRSIHDVVASRLCVGCGACAYASGGALRMINVPELGHRPIAVNPLDAAGEKACLAVCPALGTQIHAAPEVGLNRDAIAAGVGPVLEIWEGHASDADLRFQGASGGALTALACYALERENMHGVLHIGQDPEVPLQNRTFLSRNREQLRANSGSRYAPASACDGLAEIEAAPKPCVFIGQPSEVAALRNAQKLRPALDRNVGVALSFFCAGSPASQGTLELLRAKGIDPRQVERIRYRGRGWPGMFAVWLKGESQPVLEMTYRESWGVVQAFRPWAVHLWPDGSGEQADVSCGDPWYRDVVPGEPGSSLVVVRTERGRELVHGAMKAGYLQLTPASLEKVVASQKNLLAKKGSIWGRLTTQRLLGLPTPRHHGYNLWRMWLRLSWKEKLRSTFGTARRIWTRGYRRPFRLDPALVPPAARPVPVREASVASCR